MGNLERAQQEGRKKDDIESKALANIVRPEFELFQKKNPRASAEQWKAETIRVFRDVLKRPLPTDDKFQAQLNDLVLKAYPTLSELGSITHNMKEVSSLVGIVRKLLLQVSSLAKSGMKRDAFLERGRDSAHARKDETLKLIRHFISTFTWNPKRLKSERISRGTLKRRIREEPKRAALIRYIVEEFRSRGLHISPTYIRRLEDTDEIKFPSDA